MMLCPCLLRGCADQVPDYSPVDLKGRQDQGVLAKATGVALGVVKHQLGATKLINAAHGLFHQGALLF